MSEIHTKARKAIKKFTAKNIYGQDANGMQIVIGQLLNVELWDKLKGLELLGTEKNILKKTSIITHDVTTNMAATLLESGRRADERKLLMARDVTDERQQTSGDYHQEQSGDRVSITDGGGRGVGSGSDGH